MRCGCILLVGGIMLVVLGAHDVREAAVFRKQITKTYEEFAKMPPQEGWFKVTGCRLDLLETVYETTKIKGSTNIKDENGNDQMDALYIPVYSTKAVAEDAPTVLILKTDDPSIIATLQAIDNETKNFEKSKNAEAEIDAWVLKNRKRIFPEKDLSGMIATSFTTGNKVRDELSKLQSGISSNYVIMEEGKQPSTGRGFGELIGGLVMGVLSLFVLLGSIKRE